MTSTSYDDYILLTLLYFFHPVHLSLIQSCAIIKSCAPIKSCLLIKFYEKFSPVRLLDPVGLLIFDKFLPLCAY